MIVQNMWPLAFLIVIPIIVLLYLLKQRVKDEPFSSTLLWKELYENLEADTPFQKMKQNILMYLQLVLMLLLILALMTPILKNGDDLQENVVIVIDNSASMQYLYKGDESRLEYSIKRAKQAIDALSDESTVTLISCNSEATVLCQGKDKNALKKCLKEIKPTAKAGNLDLAANLVNSLIADAPQVQIICYTDTDFASSRLTEHNKSVSLVVESVYSEGENSSLDYINYTVEENGMEVLCKVTNHGSEDVVQQVSLYADSELVDVQTITIKPQTSENVFFSAQDINHDKSMILRAELSEKDCLNADNKQSVSMMADAKKKVLLCSEGNVFLEKALALGENVEIYKTNNFDVMNQIWSEETYNLYVFDGIDIPKDWQFDYLPADASVLLFDCDKDFGEKGYITKDGEVSNTVLSFRETEITEYVENFRFEVAKAYTYMLPDWARPIVKDEKGMVVGYYGTYEQRRIGVLGFDIHNTDLALQVEFPIFMSQLCGWMLEGGEEQIIADNFPVETESEVTSVSSSVVEGSKVGEKTVGNSLRDVLLLLFLLLLIVEWIIYVMQVHSDKKKQFVVVRLLVVLVVVLAMAGVSVPTKQKKMETIFLVDASDSMSENLEKVEIYLENSIREMPKGNKVGIVVFGQDTVVDQYMTDKRIFSKLTNKPVTISTNIEKAVNEACSMFTEDVVKRLVLITDGSENEGSMNRAPTTIKGKDVELYTIVMEDSISRNNEVYIDYLQAPNVIHVGDHYSVTVSVKSNVETDATLSLFAGDTTKDRQSVHLVQGDNQFVFEDVGEEGTIVQYKAVIEPQEDTIAVNNTNVAFAKIEASPRVLLIEGSLDEAKEFEKILEATNIDYDTIMPQEVPITVSELNQYKAVITLNVHYDDLTTGFATVLESYVKDFAGGYICIGGDNSYGLGNYRGTELEQILPVYMDLRCTMVFVIDQSSSMIVPYGDDAEETGLNLAKQVASTGILAARSRDEVGVLAFDDSHNWIVPIQEATDVERLKADIETIECGNGTSIFPALQEAYLEISKNDAKIKHIVLLTDGQNEYDQNDDLLEMIRKAGITVSTAAVGAESDEKTLSYIAKSCGGRFYYTDINNSISNFIKEIQLSTSDYLYEEEFYPFITSDNEVLEGVKDESWPALLGYIASTPKPTADVILESNKKDPILTIWQYGLGRTVAWNGDGTNQWTAQYATWEKYPMLWSNIIQYVISETEPGEDSIEIVKEGSMAVISYTTTEYNQKTKVEAVVTDEIGVAKELMLDPVKPGSFEASIDMDNIGVYNVSIRKKENEKIVNTYNTAYSNQYSVEYQFADTKMDLETFTKQAGGKELKLTDNLWEQKYEKVKEKVSLTVPLLVLAIVLFLFDIIIRRFSIDVVAYIRR